MFCWLRARGVSLMEAALAACWAISRTKLVSLASITVLFGMVQLATVALESFGLQACLMSFFISGTAGALAIIGGMTVSAVRIDKLSLDEFEVVFPRILAVVLVAGGLCLADGVGQQVLISRVASPNETAGLGSLMALSFMTPVHCVALLGKFRAKGKPWTTAQALIDGRRAIARDSWSPLLMWALAALIQLLVTDFGCSFLTLSSMWVLGALIYAEQSKDIESPSRPGNISA